MKKTYKVAGPHEFDGHAPGSVFEADLSEDREKRAVDAGHLAVSQAKPAEAEAEPTAAAAAVAADQARQEQEGN